MKIHKTVMINKLHIFTGIFFLDMYTKQAKPLRADPIILYNLPIQHENTIKPKKT